MAKIKSPHSAEQLALAFPDKEMRDSVLKIIAGTKHSPSPGYNVTYHFLTEKGKKSRTYTNACFGGFFANLEANPNARYLVYTVGAMKTSEEDGDKWLTLGRQVGILGQPKEVEQDFKSVKKEGYLIDLRRENMTEAKLYVELSFVRFMRDDVNLVKTTLDFMSLGISFWQAFIWSHQRTVLNPGHSFLQLGSYATDKNLCRDLGLIRRFRAFCRNSVDLKSGGLFDKKGNRAWRVAPSLSNKKNHILMAHQDWILSPVIIPIIRAPSFGRALERAMHIMGPYTSLFENGAAAKAETDLIAWNKVIEENKIKAEKEKEAANA